MPLTVRRATDADVREFSQWRYDAPYGVYDIDMEPQAAVDYFLHEDVRCHALVDDNVLVGFCTFGRDAQVPGGDYQDGPLDVGLGVRPDRTNSGHGHRYVAAVVEHAQEAYDSEGLRVTIAEGNQRAVKVWAAAGFSEVSRFTSDRVILDSHAWVILGLAAS